MSGSAELFSAPAVALSEKSEAVVNSLLIFGGPWLILVSRPNVESRFLHHQDVKEQSGRAAPLLGLWSRGGSIVSSVHYLSRGLQQTVGHA
jgi:hypothetical protein